MILKKDWGYKNFQMVVIIKACIVKVSHKELEVIIGQMDKFMMDNG